MTKTNKEETAGVATQIVYEYPEWGCEHVSDMYDTYKDCGQKAPCTYYELEDACAAAQRHKNAGLSYGETIAALEAELV